MASIDINTLFARAEAAFRAGRLKEAESLLTQVRQLAPNHSQPWHLTALVSEADGRQEDALVAFSQAVLLAPDNVPLQIDFAERLGASDSQRALGIFNTIIAASPRLTLAYLGRGRLLHRLGHYEDSRADFLRVYQLDPNLVAGWLARGAMETDAGVLAAAAIAYQRALALAPDNRVAQHGLARIALERGEADAVPRFVALARIMPDNREIAIGEAEARELAGEAEPHARLVTMLTREPGWSEGHAVLGRMLWEAGDPDFDRPLREAIAATPRSAPLHSALIDLLAGIDRFSEAADVAAAAASLTGETHFRLAEAAQAGDSGDSTRAETIFAKLEADLPGRALPEARHRVRQGRLDEAEALLETSLKANPAQIGAWALRDVVWRARSDARAEWLHGQAGLIRVHQLSVDPLEIEEIGHRLRALHHRVRHPVGQSMRGGTQTRGRLFSRMEPFVARLRAAVSDAVLDHWRGLPGQDDRHPLLRHRNLTPTLSGSWSVRLTGGGHHVSHIHPDGILSSASYWVLPDQMTDDAGWLEIGRPPENLGLDLPPLARFAPEPGKLVLFPSTIFHGTRPFASGERITMAFDIAAS